VGTPFVDQRGDKAGPTRLVGCTETHARIAVEVLVESEVVAPVRIRLELFDIAVLGSTTVRIARKHGDQSIGMRAGDIVDRPSLAITISDRQIVTVSLG